MQSCYSQVLCSHTCVLHAPVDHLWSLVQQWCPSLWIRDMHGDPVQMELLSGVSGQQVGCTRMTIFPTGRVVEQLVAVDAAEHYLTWKVLSDPRAVNPFPAAFIDWRTTLRFTPLSSGKATMAQWTGEFWTEHPSHPLMQELLESFFSAALSGLEKQMQPTRAESGLSVDIPKDLLSASGHMNHGSVQALARQFGASFR